MLFVAFGATLLGIALFHRHSLWVALLGLATITAIRWQTGFHEMAGFAGLTNHATHEWVSVSNIFLLIMGFELVAKYFAASNIPIVLPNILPDDWKGGLVLLLLVFGGSAFLDNIAAAMIGGMIATTVYKGQVSVGFVAAIVAAANLGGAPSVIGDTTTTMMWISGISPAAIFPAMVGSVTALSVVAVFAAKQQHRYHPIMKDPPLEHHRVDGVYLGIVIFILGGAVTTNILVNQKFRDVADHLPWIGLAVWIGILLSALVRTPHWSSLKGAAKSATFLSALILSASMMPIEELPRASTIVTFGLGLLSAVFDNIPLTALALKQGGYHSALLAYSVGFGGSITWFGSSAGVAICNEFPNARSLGAWLRGGWFILPAYIAGFLAIVAYIALFG